MIAAELSRGNLPDFLRRLQPVSLESRGPAGIVRVTVWVMPDYLAVGSDADHVRLPMSFHAATAIARAFDMALPTPPVVDAVWRQAAIRLAPSPMTPGPEMTRMDYFIRHDARIHTALAGRSSGVLVAGHKKDLVLTSLLQRRPSRVAIYGWHRLDGSAIQPLSTVHGASYADYSHGVRLMSRTVLVDGQPRDLLAVTRDPRYARVLTGESGVMDLERLQAAPVPSPIFAR